MRKWGIYQSAAAKTKTTDYFISVFFCRTGWNLMSSIGAGMVTTICAQSQFVPENRKRQDIVQIPAEVTGLKEHE